MRLPYLHLTAAFLLVSLAWSNSVDDDDDDGIEDGDDEWPWHKTKYLTRANWTSSLKANTNTSKIHQPVWFVFNYLTYCGYCKHAKPGWEAAARYAAGWSRYIRIGAYDCANEEASQTDICQDEAFPTWRIFCPATNTTQLAFDSARRSGDTKPEDIFMWAIKKANKIAHLCYGKTWPVRHVIEPQTMDDLNRLIPKNYKTFQLFVSDDVLLYSLYVFNHSKTVFKDPIYRLHVQNPIKPGVGLWKGARNDHGQIILEKMDATQAMAPFVLNVINSSHTDKPERMLKKLGALKPTVTDIDSAIVWMLNRDVRRKLPALFDDVKAWLKVLHANYPGSDQMANFLRDLITFMDSQTTLTSKEFQNYVNTTSVIKLPELKFDHCIGPDPGKRGYPCALWVLFHGMTVKQALLAEDNKLPSNVKPADLAVSIREFIRKFFQCDECAKHFTNMTTNAENEVHSYKESVLYLWRAHNTVNKRLRGDELSTDPAWPKVPFPTKEECDACVRRVDENSDAIEHDDNEVYKYLKGYYDLQNISPRKSIATQQHYSCFLVLLPLIVLFRF